MDNTAKFILAVLVLLPFDYAIIKFVDLFIYKLKNGKSKTNTWKKLDTNENTPEIDKEF